MGAIFTSPGRTVGAGVVLLIVIVVVIGAVTGQMTKIDHAWGTFVMRWLHVLSGVLWIGLLWYLNFVQVPTMPSIPAENRVAITKFIAPNVLFYFRYAALATVITGLLLAFMQRLSGAGPDVPEGLHHDRHRHVDGPDHGLQRLVHHLAEPAEDPGPRSKASSDAEEKAAAAKPALYASRFNTMFSIGMLYCMVAQQNAPI